MKQIRETSDFVCKKLIEKLPITDGSKILEPSIGEGKIIKYLLDHYTMGGLDIHGLELNKERVFTASDNLYPYRDVRGIKVNIQQGDFLDYKPNLTKPFDVIIACPPFKGNIDLRHIGKMYEMLKYKGMMASLTSPYWMTNNEPLQVEFRNWLKDKNYQFELLPDNTFVEKEKNVPTGIITIYKK